MASKQNYDYHYPYFPPTPPRISPPKMPPTPPKVAPPHPPTTSPPSAPKFPPPAPPPHHSFNPPPPAPPPHHSFNPTPPPPKFPPPAPPPPFHPIHPPPPPPHIIPTPPSPGHHSTVIVIIFVSLGGLFFLAFLSVALCCFIKKKKKRRVQETDVVKIDEHLKIKEAIIPGPHGPQTVILSVEDDIHIQKDVKKNEIETVGKGHSQLLDMEASTSDSSHHHQEHKTG